VNFWNDNQKAIVELSGGQDCADQLKVCGVEEGSACKDLPNELSNRNGLIRVRSHTWYHLALVIEGEKASVYVNGELSMSDPSMFDLSELKKTSTKIFLGDAHALLDEVKIFNKALSQLHVKADMTTVGINYTYDICTSKK
jgi:hypothetical protein